VTKRGRDSATKISQAFPAADHARVARVAGDIELVALDTTYLAALDKVKGTIDAKQRPEMAKEIDDAIVKLKSATRGGHRLHQPVHRRARQLPQVVDHQRRP
jgi:hypothetical protein